MKHLIIVESPAKARTIQAFLGADYEVIASKGHIRDLPKFSFGITIKEQEFFPQYEIDSDHKELVKTIQKLAKKATTIYIATDEDREGEAIGYHITQIIDKHKPLESFPRIVFHEITKQAITHALKQPRIIDMHRVQAQQARRLLDRIVGFKLSTLLQQKISKGLSAGRVQSAALKIIIDREREIRAFIPRDYFTIIAIFQGIESELTHFHGKKLQKLDIHTQEEAQAMLEELLASNFIVRDIIKKEKNSPTPPPFMTSTLQQSASSLLSFSPSRTMNIAQRLYEGVATPNGVMGVITYMRTDSLNIASIAQDSARKHIEQTYGSRYIPKTPKHYTSKAKSAQEAHEAIRPTNIHFTPAIAKAYLKPDELKLYTLIYQRFLASQSVDAIYEVQDVFFTSDKGECKAHGRRLIFDGFLAILGSDDKDTLLPTFTANTPISLESIKAHKHTTEPPSRYSEASLIKMLESLGIGRPSTYAPTISLLASREYLIINNRQLLPQDAAFQVIEFLEQYFCEIVDVAFSSDLEEQLDAIALAKHSWQSVLWGFYEPFIEKITQGKTHITSQKLAIPIGEFCPECGKELLQRKSRYGTFIGCSGYPKCRYIKQEEVASSGQICEKCGKEMIKKFSKKGEFLACSGYPTCKNTKSLQEKKLITLDVPCPECKGELVERVGRRGVFFGCKNYPTCTFISSSKPTNILCKSCGYVLGISTRKNGEYLACLRCKARYDGQTLEPLAKRITKRQA